MPKGKSTISEFACEVGRRLKSRRKQLRLSARQVLERIDGLLSDQTMIYGYERGEFVPKLDVFMALCAALECSPLDILPDTAKARSLAITLDVIQTLK